MEEEFLLNKISRINYKIAVHEGCANERLASQTGLIFTIPTAIIPDPYKIKFNELVRLLENTVKDFPGLMIPVRVKGIYNKTAVKYIILLMEIEEHLNEILK
ncbi:hypothetical protein ABW636_22225 [Aquimarina sp. 2201CG1-2-11]|uniref:hypothetical protein n=1 Tax=Aquimarina discodermiae TaxID=3231043 RepID=UPI0034621269